MGFLQELCTLSALNKETLSQCQPFSCGDADLDEFFLNDADNYNRQLLGKSYCYRLNTDLSIIVCAFTLANSGIEAKRLPGSRRKKLTEKVPHEKTLTSYPALLIGRMGVNIDFAKKGIGTELMDFIKGQLLTLIIGQLAVMWLLMPTTMQVLENTIMLTASKTFFRANSKKRNTWAFLKIKN